MALNRDVVFKYLGHSTFLFTTPAAKTLLIDPWVQNNPACPDDDKKIESLDTMLITHTHFDHIQDAVELGKGHQPQIGCIFEIANWLEKKGVQNVNAMNKGGSQQLNDVRVTMVDARHSCGISEDDGSISYGGEAAGYVVEFENGFRIYHAGDTCVFGDMKIIAELYQPELIFLPIGDLFTMSPKEAAYACRLMNAKKVVPMHYGTFPPLTGTPQQLRELIRDLGTEVLEIRPGESLGVRP
ncbi:metal-dependent hydrolase [Acidobacteria bacterium AH-259-L09]|nr:metal-dependent hydrolase [Acidobacteria bacterium AH-259-L09]